MSQLFHQETLQDRAQNLGVLNGLRLVFVHLEPPAAPTHAWLDVEFHNGNSLAAILNDVNVNGVAPTDIFTLRGGTRIPGGEAVGQVQVHQVAAGTGDALRLRVAPIGDYSTYTLHVRETDGGGVPILDPLFSQIGFKFRPGCFNLNCSPTWEGGEARAARPVIDYLAKDFDSFKHTLINALRERVPGWAPTSEADLDQVLIDLIAADADELSDYQDRVMNEAYFGRARRRVALARHARLMDYHVHQGNQSSTWLAATVAADLTLPAQFGVWSGEAWNEPGAVIFVTAEEQDCFALLNRLELYTWDGAVSALEAGTTEADLALPAPLVPGNQGDADTLRDLLRGDAVRYLVLEEKLNPETGTVHGRDTTKRQLLRLAAGDAAAESVFDPLAGEWMVRVHWLEEDRLTRRYCFVTRCTSQPPQEGLSAFCGNLVEIRHGRPHRTVFRPPGSELGPTDASQLVHTDEARFEPTPWGVICPLPNAPLAYRNTPPGGEVPVRSTLVVEVAGFAAAWQEQSDLIESEADDEHFLVETDEESHSRIRFGNAVNGRELDEDAVVTCRYQVGRGSLGNVGCDVVTGFDPTAVAGLETVRNPFDVTDGRDPELVEEIRRRATQAYRGRQLRAVTLADYVRRAEELPGVSHAYAGYAWTGSWRTVRVSIDPAGTTELSDELRHAVEGHLDAVRLIGEDLEVRGARFAPLDIRMRLCAHPDYWPEDLSAELEIELSDGCTPDGRQGFFHPDLWTFGQPLYTSQLIARALAVTGVERVLEVSLRRLDAVFGPTTATLLLNPEDVVGATVEKVEVEPYEVIRVANDPDHLEHGRILFDISGGRR